MQRPTLSHLRQLPLVGPAQPLALHILWKFRAIRRNTAHVPDTLLKSTHKRRYVRCFSLHPKMNELIASFHIISLHWLVPDTTPTGHQFEGRTSCELLRKFLPTVKRVCIQAPQPRHACAFCYQWSTYRAFSWFLPHSANKKWKSYASSNTCFSWTQQNAPGVKIALPVG